MASVGDELSAGDLVGERVAIGTIVRIAFQVSQTERIRASRGMDYVRGRAPGNAARGLRARCDATGSATPRATTLGRTVFAQGISAVL